MSSGVTVSYVLRCLVSRGKRLDMGLTFLERGGAGVNLRVSVLVKVAQAEICQVNGVVILNVQLVLCELADLVDGVASHVLDLVDGVTSNITESPEGPAVFGFRDGNVLRRRVRNEVLAYLGHVELCDLSCQRLQSGDSGRETRTRMMWTFSR